MPFYAQNTHNVEYRKRIDNPIVRFRLYTEARRWWNAEEEEELKAWLKADVMQVFKHAEALLCHELGKLFTDVYAGEELWNIADQRNGLTGLLKKYGQAWELWWTELAKFKNGGKDLTQSGA
ncbi:hypothetical protein B0H14DRAFT_3740698 [Mycena olivaceomarginata]|nr:hypothetical protein B0H14DRAFT_3740698 [Mycena olivaceomarginata]